MTKITTGFNNSDSSDASSYTEILSTTNFTPLGIDHILLQSENVAKIGANPILLSVKDATGNRDRKEIALANSPYIRPNQRLISSINDIDGSTELTLTLPPQTILELFLYPTNRMVLWLDKEHNLPLPMTIQFWREYVNFTTPWRVTRTSSLWRTRIPPQFKLTFLMHRTTSAPKIMAYLLAFPSTRLSIIQRGLISPPLSIRARELSMRELLLPSRENRRVMIWQADPNTSGRGLSERYHFPYQHHYSTGWRIGKIGLQVRNWWRHSNWFSSWRTKFALTKLIQDIHSTQEQKLHI